MRRHRRQQEQKRFSGKGQNFFGLGVRQLAFFLYIFIKQVDKLHAAGNGSVKHIALRTQVLGDRLDRFVHCAEKYFSPLIQRAFIDGTARSLEIGANHALFVELCHQPPDATKEAKLADCTVFIPFQLLLGGRGKEGEEASGVCSIMFEEISRADDIATRLGHLLGATRYW